VIFSLLSRTFGFTLVLSGLWVAQAGAQSIVVERNLNFGRIYAASGAGTVTVAPSYTAVCTATIVSSDNPSACDSAVLRLSGPANSIGNVTFTPNGFSSIGGVPGLNLIFLDSTVGGPGGTVNLDAAGQGTLFIGGQLSIPASPSVGGVRSLTVDIEITY